MIVVPAVIPRQLCCEEPLLVLPIGENLFTDFEFLNAYGIIIGRIRVKETKKSTDTQMGADGTVKR